MNEVKTQHIGNIHFGIDGNDEYVLLEFAEDTTSDAANEWLLQQVYRDTTQEAGGYFCKRVTIMPNPYHANKFVGVIHHQYDV
jgi:hypothetical protein